MTRAWTRESQKHLGRRKYGGQSKAAKSILPLLPKGTKIVEPFAGHAHVSVAALKSGKFSEAVLGDLNCKALTWVKKNRKTDKIKMKCQDWKKTVAQNDGPNTVFVFDPPWKAETSCYTAYRGNCKQVADEIVEKSKSLRGGSVLLLGDTPEHRKIACSRSSKFHCKTITVDSKIFGNKSEWKEIVAIKK